MESMEIYLEETKKILARMEEKLNKCAVLDNNFVEEDITVDVSYVSEAEGLKMIVDSGAPLLIVIKSTTNIVCDSC